MQKQRVKIVTDVLTGKVSNLRGVKCSHMKLLVFGIERTYCWVLTLMVAYLEVSVVLSKSAPAVS